MTIESNLYANLSGAISEAGRTLYMTSKIPDIDLTGRAGELQKYLAQMTLKILSISVSCILCCQHAPKKQVRATRHFKQVYGRSYRGCGLTQFCLPPQLMVNIAGNSIYQGLHILETVAAAGIGRVRSMATGSKDRARLRDAIIHLDAVRESLRDALVVSAKEL